MSLSRSLSVSTYPENDARAAAHVETQGRFTCEGWRRRRFRSAFPKGHDFLACCICSAPTVKPATWIQDLGQTEMKCGKICCAWSGEMKTFTKESPGCKVLRDPSASMHSLYVLPSVSDLQRGEKKKKHHCAGHARAGHIITNASVNSEHLTAHQKSPTKHEAKLHDSWSRDFRLQVLAKNQRSIPISGHDFQRLFIDKSFGFVAITNFLESMYALIPQSVHYCSLVFISASVPHGASGPRQTVHILIPKTKLTRNGHSDIAYILKGARKTSPANSKIDLFKFEDIG